jgi:hypothetical protein
MEYQNRTPNLKPFKKGYDSRRQVGRKKGSINRKTAIKDILASDLELDMMFLPNARAAAEQLGGDKSVIEAITYSLVNQAMGGNPQAAHILLREKRHIEDKEPDENSFFASREPITFEVVYTDEEQERMIRKAEAYDKLKAEIDDQY